MRFVFLRWTGLMGVVFSGACAMGGGDVATDSKSVRGTTIQSVVAGGAHSCALLYTGGIKCWGSDAYGQVGDGPASTSDKYSAVSVRNAADADFTDAVDLVGGDLHTCALTSDGTVWCWGYNFYGQLGKGDSGAGTDSSLPVAVSSLSGRAVSITAGANHTCAVMDDGTAKCWGSNGDGQLGDGTTTQRVLPTLVKDSAGTGWLNNVAEIKSGNSSAHTCAATADGQAWCWGRDANGQIGDGDEPGTDPDQLLPAKVRNVVTSVCGTPGTDFNDVKGLALGGAHSCALLGVGQACCWGSDSQGQLGNGNADTVNQYNPVPVKQDGGALFDTLAAIGSGASHSCATRADGSGWCWGWNANGQLGNNDSTLTSKHGAVHVKYISGIFDLYNAIPIEGGANHSCGLSRGGYVYCWGRDNSGQIGDGDEAGNPDPNQLFAVTVVGITGNAIGFGIAAGGAHSCGVRSDGEVKCWGKDDNGQIGNGDAPPIAEPDPDVATPASVSGSLDNATMISAGGGRQTGAATDESHSCAVTTLGAVLCWGSNSNGQLGTGTVDHNYYTAQQVPGFFNAVEVRAGTKHTCALKADGSVWCWGLNIEKQLGNGTTTDSITPVRVQTSASAAYLDHAVAVSAGNDHSCALKDDGTVWCWGSNLRGESGDCSGAITVVYAKQVGDLANVVAISAGGLRDVHDHTCALLANGTVKCWGADYLGQVGDGGTCGLPEGPQDLEICPPVTVTNLTGAVAISAGGAVSCAVKSDGTAWCWGFNAVGQLGAGNNLGGCQSAPVRVKKKDPAYPMDPSGCPLDTAPDLMKVIDIDVGSDDGSLPGDGRQHACALTSSGDAYCWGMNTHEQLGTAQTYNPGDGSGASCAYADKVLSFP